MRHIKRLLALLLVIGFITPVLVGCIEDEQRKPPPPRGPKPPPQKPVPPPEAPMPKPNP